MDALADFQEKENIQKKNTEFSKLNLAIEALSKIKNRLERIRDQEKCEMEIKKQVEAEILSIIEQNDIKSYSCMAGKIEIRNNLSYKTPKTTEEKKLLLEYIQAKGEDVFYQLVGVNSQTLNAFCKREVENAAAANIFPFEVPGVGDPTSYKTVVLKSSKPNNGEEGSA